MNALIQKAEKIVLLDQEIDEIKSDLRDRRSIYLKKLHAELKEKMQPYSQIAKDLTERAKEAKSIEMDELIAGLKGLNNQEYNDVYWNNAVQVIRDGNKWIQTGMLGYPGEQLELEV